MIVSHNLRGIGKKGAHKIRKDNKLQEYCLYYVTKNELHYKDTYQEVGIPEAGIISFFFVRKIRFY